VLLGLPVDTRIEGKCYLTQFIPMRWGLTKSRPHPSLTCNLKLDLWISVYQVARITGVSHFSSAENEV
jgi:hypothetical protein